MIEHDQHLQAQDSMNAEDECMYSIACRIAFIANLIHQFTRFFKADAKNAITTQSEACQIIDKGQNLLLTQAFTPTFSEDMHGKSTRWSLKCQQYESLLSAHTSNFLFR